ncbi:LysE/ArgO family amino acid transporter [Sansalvadorimonas sp. 2012CJ34-2]|uniref:LysE/ArgO family amino acid transporter n=1 Tax=Parendozoicomonas callyspongiae TaxID=2942213 RepID=A0ABT0PG26_9GAMM|nr:LysE/ArgO family amino acid transporter [Sansalvadorimonas sp. 2012CJ34-2]MCL6270324.1 LysE/ArgO family amino acid transporter [Sansalvadorimonas sp. 2012CJ34-2]
MPTEPYVLSLIFYTNKQKTDKHMLYMPFVQGFTLGASLIIAIGAQNVWVLKRGIARNFHFFVATICVLCDIALIFAGVFGAGSLIASNETALSFIAIGGAAFLFWYGLTSLRSALRPAGSLAIAKGEVDKKYSQKGALLTTLAFTLLNPHVYLDTVVILGGIGAQFEGAERWLFASGTALASVIWFYGLAAGAAKLAPALSRPRVRQGIDLFVCVLMWSIAATLVIKWFN